MLMSTNTLEAFRKRNNVDKSRTEDEVNIIIRTDNGRRDLQNKGRKWEA